jgi:hypothetical protein
MYGAWDGRPKLITRTVPKAAPPSAPAYDYNKRDDWKAYVTEDGDILPKPRGRFP